MFKFSAFQAPSRYVWKDPDTGREFVADSKIELLNHIRQYRAQNDLSEIEYLDMAVDDYLCQLPENVGKCEKVVLKRGWFQYVSGGLNLVKNVFYGEKNMVDQYEAERRADICVSCPNNFFPDRNDFTIWADSLAVASTGGKKTSKDKLLGNCDACSCTLKAKVHQKGPFKLSKEVESKMPLFCWQLQDRV